MLAHVTPAAAAAHAGLVRSAPSAGQVLTDPPATLSLWFSEAPDARFSAARLYDASGNQLSLLGPLQGIDSDTRQLVAAFELLPGGVYTVAWRATSVADGHVTSGAFAFAIGPETVPPAGVQPSVPANVLAGNAGFPSLLPAGLDGATAGSAVLAGGVVCLAAAGLRLKRSGRLTGGLVAAGIAAVALGGTVAMSAALGERMPSPPNPVPPDAASLRRGKDLYESNCAGCHGRDGRDDGPSTTALVAEGANLRAHVGAGHSDWQLFQWISKGVPGTRMAAWGGRLSEQDRWHLVNYLRTFQERGTTDR